MAKFGLQQRGERRVAAALRIAFAALLLSLHIGLVVLLAYLLRQYAAIVYALLQIAGLVVAVGIYNRRGDAMYKLTWIILILTVPVVGLILFLLWGYGAEQAQIALAQSGYALFQAMEAYDWAVAGLAAASAG